MEKEKRAIREIKFTFHYENMVATWLSCGVEMYEKIESFVFGLLKVFISNKIM